MRVKTITALVAAAVLAAGLALTACSSGDGGVDEGVVTTFASEPQNPLVPTNTNENMGGRVVDRLWAGLKYYDADGNAHDEMAQSIDTTDRQHYKITIKPDWKFTNGEPVTAKSFVDAWNYGALSTNGQNQNWVFSLIQGYDDLASNPPKAQTMSGLKVLDDHTFTVDLKNPSIDFTLQLGFAPYYPLPSAAYKDMKAFGENPIGNGPYKFARNGAWQHQVSIDLVPNPDYHGGRPPKNKGLQFKMYQSYEAGYNDLLGGNLDTIDRIPNNALTTFKKDLGDRAIVKPTAQSEHIGIQSSLPHFSGQEGLLRREAISMAINREQISDTIFHGTKGPAKDFTATTLPGFNPNVPGNEVLQYNPDQAKKVWAQADAISPWSGKFEIAYNADGTHQAWVEATANSIKNTLGIDASATPLPTFKQIRDQVHSKTIGKAFRYGWQGDYPSMLEFLTSQYQTGSETNDVGYSDPEFDNLLVQAQSAATPEDSYKVITQAQAVLFRDMADIPVLDYKGTGGYSVNVKSAQLSWSGLFDFENIQKN